MIIGAAFLEAARSVRDSSDVTKPLLKKAVTIIIFFCQMKDFEKDADSVWRSSDCAINDCD